MNNPKNILLAVGTISIDKTMFLPSPDVNVFGLGNQTVVAPKKGVIAFQGVGNCTETCPKCNYILARNIFLNQVQSLAVQCPHCGTIKSFHER
ncbi:MAG: hypothetical protein ABSD42_13925 [Candidatus Bathyarchaeia archaeon]|jgi:hypothetical protein